MVLEFLSRVYLFLNKTLKSYLLFYLLLNKTILFLFYYFFLCSIVENLSYLFFCFALVLPILNIPVIYIFSFLLSFF